ncbi:hypothetical protein [Minisyncoccus archaeiphilus]|uniref:hypothetical protein n=1 Tax=Minisyncoccus archaeiphilus TaxID=3238481 RepID=UPI00399C6763
MKRISIKSMLSFLKRLPRNLFFWVFNGIKWIFISIFRGVVWLLKDIYRKKIRILFAIGLAVGAYYLWGLSSSLLWGLFLIFLFCAWDSRVIASLALMCLSACPVLLHLKMDKTAEEVAVYAYFFLVMTVVLQIFEYWRDERKEKLRGPEMEQKSRFSNLLLSEKIRLVMGDYREFVRDVKNSSLNVDGKIKENEYIFLDKDKDEKIDTGELIERGQMSLLKEEKEENRELMKLDLYEDYEMMEIEKKKMELMKKEEEKTQKLL